MQVAPCSLAETTTQVSSFDGAAIAHAASPMARYPARAAAATWARCTAPVVKISTADFGHQFADIQRTAKRGAAVRSSARPGRARAAFQQPRCRLLRACARRVVVGQRRRLRRLRQRRRCSRVSVAHVASGRSSARQLALLHVVLMPCSLPRLAFLLTVIVPCLGLTLALQLWRRVSCHRSARRPARRTAPSAHAPLQPLRCGSPCRAEGKLKGGAGTMCLSYV